jgi:hypothetical protein
MFHSLIAQVLILLNRVMVVVDDSASSEREVFVNKYLPLLRSLCTPSGIELRLVSGFFSFSIFNSKETKKKRKEKEKEKEK